MLAERRVTDDKAPARSFGSIFDSLERYGDRLALIDGERSFSFNDLIDKADHIGNLVRSRKLALIICSNDIDAVAAYVGLSRAGVVPMLMPDTIPQQQLQKIISAFQPFYVFAPNKHLVGFPSASTLMSCGGYSLNESISPPDINIHNDLALLLSTSGSTGSLKFVRQSYANLQSNTDAIIDFLGIRPSDRAITTMPMSYTYGLSILNTHLAVGASVILTENPMIGKPFWDKVQQHAPTTFGGVPFIYEMLKKLRFENMNIPSLRYITQAGGRLAADLTKEIADACSAKGIDFISMYGQTEATARMSYVPASQASAKAGTIGIAIPGGNFWLRGENGQTIDAPGSSGELMYQGANVSLGYAKSFSDLARHDDNGGTLATGDIAEFDYDGYFYIVGRMTRFLKIYGYRVNLDEFEQNLRATGFDCACVGEDDALSIFVVGAAPADVKCHVTDTTTVNPRAIRVHQIDTLPRNEAGKLLYPELQRLLS